MARTLPATVRVLQRPAGFAGRRMAGLMRGDSRIALALAAAAALAYGLTARPDWSFDPLRYADQMQRDRLDELLVGPQHVLGNLIPLAAYRALRAAGTGVDAWPVMAVAAVLAAGATVGLVFLAARAFGATRGAAAVGAGLLAVTPGMWRAGASGGVYGVVLLTLVLGWIAGGRYLASPGPRRAAVLGVAAGAAVAGHLGSLVFVPAAVVLLVAGRAPRSRRVPVRSLAAFAGGAAAVVAVAFVAAAGLATGFDPGGMAQWLFDPEIGGPAKRPAVVGWGTAGLFEGAILPGKSRGFSLQVAVTLGFIVVAAARGGGMLRRHGRTRIGGAALLLHVGVAALAASWFQALRADYWMPAILSLTIAGAAGPPLVAHRLRARLGRRSAHRIVAATAAVAVAGLGAWNVSHDVAGRLRITGMRAEAAALLGEQIPRGGYVLLFPELAGRLALDGFDAEGGWAALARQVESGAEAPGLIDALRAVGDRPIYVSSLAFDLEEWQVEYLGSDAGELWLQLWACCEPREVMRFEANLGPEVLYRLGRVPPAGEMAPAG